ncbi:MAG: 2,4-dihydroxyhept-2-ene-1,7-dioic acid aldolase [Anaerolineae bacterium]|nr:2,4-dihydroxyhept-2-ene-1,7-dioic acid aldolase [Anaerolineae bacterium]
MMHQFRQRLLAGERLVGPMVTLGAPEVAEILAKVGFDWLFLDAEHAPFDALSLQRMMQAAGNTPCLVRLEASQEVPIKKALDVGAAGIIAPMVNTAEQAAQIVSWCRYSPQGTRGVGLGRAHGYGLEFSDYIEAANESVTVIVQAEHIQAAEQIEAIVQVEGVDGVLIGPYDLSASLGLLGQIEHPEVVAAIDRVTAVCQQAKIPLGVFGLSATAVQPYIEKGYTLITVGVDTLLLSSAASSLLQQVRSGIV